MNTPNHEFPAPAVSRRSFLQTSSRVTAGGALFASLPVAGFVHAASDDTLKIALVGCGGRGAGAADQALSTAGPVRLVAVADVVEEGAQTALRNLREKHGNKVDVPPERLFIGFDGYKKAIALADVVILATPPGFRAMMFEEAVRQGKHVFAEKPVCVDAAGFHQFLAAAEDAKRKNLKIGIGLQRHHSPGYIENIQRLHDGDIGQIVAMRACWTGGPPWVHERDVLEQQAGRRLTELEYQVRNWVHFVWLSGDHIVEQHVHNLDVINWVKGGPPVKARGLGGRDPGKSGGYGEIFNHHTVEFTYADGSVCQSMCHQQTGCWAEVSEFAVGTKGQSQLDRHWISGPKAWRHREKGAKINPYQQEHDDLFDAIRNNKPYNEAEYGATSSFTAVLGRMATYSGKEITWEQAVASKVESMVKGIDQLPYAEAAQLQPPSLPDAAGRYKVAVPGDAFVI